MLRGTRSVVSMRSEDYTAHKTDYYQAAPSNPYAPSTNHNRLAAFDSSPARLPPQAYSPHPTIHQIPVSQQTPSHYLAPTSRPMHPSPPMHSSSYQEPFGQRHDQYQPSPPSHISQASETRLFVDHRQAPVRSSTEPNTVSRRPPADDVKLAHAPSFPMFPTERASARQDAPDNLLATGNAFDLRPTSPTHTGPVSPGLVNRMNTITSGPFGARSRRPEPASDSRGPYRSPLAAANTTTTTSAQTPASSAEGATAPPRPPRPDSDYGLVQGLRALSTNEHVELTSRALPEQETPTPTSFTLSQAPNPIIPLRPPPVTIPIYDRLDGHRPNTAPSAPEPGMRPLPDYTGLHSAVSRKPSHISTSSSSSSGSRSMFGSRTDSSRSSHSTPFNLRTSVEAHPKAHYLDRDVPNAEQYLSLIAQSEAEESAFGDPSPLLSQSSWNATSPYHSDYRPHTSHSVMTTSPDSMDQPPVTFPMRSESIGRLQPSHNRPSRTSKPKGDCRGCGTPITGRSIKAADGRLTGRYHRECKAPQTPSACAL